MSPDREDGMSFTAETTFTAEIIERVARALCEEAGYEPESLNPGNIVLHPLDDLAAWRSSDGVFIDQLCDDGTRPPDGHDGKDQCHFMWRKWIGPAQAACRAVARCLRAPPVLRGEK